MWLQGRVCGERETECEIVELGWAQPHNWGSWWVAGPGWDCPWGCSGEGRGSSPPQGACSQGWQAEDGASPTCLLCCGASERSKSAPTWRMVHCEGQILLHLGPAGEWDSSVITGSHGLVPTWHHVQGHDAEGHVLRNGVSQGDLIAWLAVISAQIPGPLSLVPLSLPFL